MHVINQSAFAGSPSDVFSLFFPYASLKVISSLYSLMGCP